MDWLEWFKSVKRNAESLKGLYLILVSEYKPEKTIEIQNFRRIVKQKFLIPMRMPSILYQD